MKAGCENTIEDRWEKREEWGGCKKKGASRIVEDKWARMGEGTERANKQAEDGWGKREGGRRGQKSQAIQCRMEGERQGGWN